MQTLDVENPGLPDLQFVLMVLALCTSDLEAVNVPDAVRRTVFDRCWALIHNTPPLDRKEDLVLDMRDEKEMTVEAMVELYTSTYAAHGNKQLACYPSTQEPPPHETPEAVPLV